MLRKSLQPYVRGVLHPSGKFINLGHIALVLGFGGLLNGVLNILGNGKMDVSAKVSCTHVYSAR